MVTEIVPITKHESTTTEGKGYIIKAATKCVADGEERVVCKYCGQQFTRPISAHNYDKGTVEVAAKCTETGIIKKTCKDCGATTTEEIEALGHNLGEIIKLVPATCEKTGISEKVCSRCGYEEKTITKATGHESTGDDAIVWLDEDGKEVTSVPSEKQHTCYYTKANKYTCKNENCDEKDKIVYEIEKSVTGHIIDYTKQVKEGYATLKATPVSGETDVYEYIEGNYELENGKIKLTTTGTVDCSHAKVKTFTCATCGQPETVVIQPATKHTGVVTTYSATCQSVGYTLTSCTKCNKVIKEMNEDEEVLAHDFVIEKATCEKDAKIVCSMCGDKATATITVTEEGEYSCPEDGVNNKGFKAFFTALTDPQKATATKKATGHRIVGVVDGKGYCGNAWCDKEDRLVNITPFEKVPTTVQSTDLLDKNLTDLQTDVEISLDGKVTGTLKYVTEYNGFNPSNENEQKGNYLVLYFPEAKTGTVVTCELKGAGTNNPNKAVKVDPKDGLIILKIANVNQTVEVVSTAANGVKTVRTLTLTGLTLKNTAE